MISKSFSSASGVLLAAAIATGGFSSTAEAREKVTMKQYCAAQTAPGTNRLIVHNNMDPYKNKNITVTLQSKHGPITMPFDCTAVMPDCAKQKIIFTEGALSIVHAGLGSYNKNDPEGVSKTMAKLAKSYKFVKPSSKDAVDSLKHLDEIHGMPVLYLSDKNTIERKPNGTVIVKGCAAELNR